MLTFVDSILARFDSAYSAANWFSISEELNKGRPSHDLTPDEQAEFDADFLAFHLVPREERNNSKTYWMLPAVCYSPGGSGPEPTVSEYILDLWRERVHSSEHPAREARYADLVWDLGPSAGARKRNDHLLGKEAINAYLRLIQDGHLQHCTEGNDVLDRVLEIATSLKDDNYIAQVVDAILSRAENASPLNSAGIWAYAADTLHSSKYLTANQRKRLTQEMEKRFQEAIASQNSSAADRGLSALFALYPKDKGLGERQRILPLYAKMQRNVYTEVSAMVAITSLLPTVELLEDHQLQDDAESLRLYVEERGSLLRQEMREYTSTTEIDRKQLDSQLDDLIGDHELFVSLYRLSVATIPKLEEVRAHLASAQKHTPLQFLVTGISFEESGLPISQRSGDGRSAAHLLRQYGHSLSYSAVFFQFGLERLKLKHNFDAASIMSSLENCPLIASDRLDIVRDGLLALESQDYLKAIHILVPQVEAMMRQLLNIMGIPITKKVRGFPGLAELKSMSDFFRDPRIVEALEEDLLWFLRSLYVDKQSYNLRNELCHGVAPKSVFNRQVSGLVFQSVILLSAVNADYISIREEPGTP